MNNNAANAVKGKLTLAGVVFALCVLAFSLMPQHALAASNTAVAYDRSLAAVKAYNSADGSKADLHATYLTDSRGYSVIEVDVRDLALSRVQAQQVIDRLYFNTDIFYIDACGDGKYDTVGARVATLRYTCTYKDSEIPAKKKAFAAKTSKALARIKNCKDAAEKVHMVHDWVRANIANVSSAKMKSLQAQGLWYRYKCSAGLIEGYADCNGFTYIMDYLLRKAGFKTALVININEKKNVDHCWNLVRLGSNWYHVDVTWDKAWSYLKTKGAAFYNVPCHYWMLVSDKVMNGDEHKGWTVWKNGVAVSTPKARKANAKGVYCATSSKYDAPHYDSDSNYKWPKPCAKSLAKGKTFTVSGVKYAVTKKGSAVKVSGTKPSCTVPVAVWYRGYSYAVSGIGVGALASCKKLTIKSGTLTKSSVRNCLRGSKVSTITLKGAAKVKRTAYKKIFAKSNSGRKVRVR